ncbi:MAG TPA: 50S ribosomal protein L13 [Asticcacaulis sp.]|jgi:large subunit ribosomal protein L13
MLTSTTAALKPADVEKKWIVIDAEDAVLGRLAAFIAMRLRGKHLPNFTPHTDGGDNVIVINAEKVHLTGKKHNEIFYWHTGHPGGVKQRTLGQLLNGKYPERVLTKAVERMMPKESPLARKQMTQLRIYAGATHPHEAQTPEVIDFKALSRKNVRSA